MESCYHLKLMVDTFFYFFACFLLVIVWIIRHASKKYKFFVTKAYKDLKSPLVYRVNFQKRSDQILGNYYLNFDLQDLMSGGSYHFEFDDNKIPIVKGNSADGDESYYYNPQAICQFALGLFSRYIGNENKEDLNILS